MVAVREGMRLVRPIGLVGGTTAVAIASINLIAALALHEIDLAPAFASRGVTLLAAAALYWYGSALVPSRVGAVMQIVASFVLAYMSAFDLTPGSPPGVLHLALGIFLIYEYGAPRRVAAACAVAVLLGYLAALALGLEQASRLARYRQIVAAVLASGTLAMLALVADRRASSARREADRLRIVVGERTMELEQRLHERERLLMEVHHRVRNNLQVIESLLRITAEQEGERYPGHALATIDRRIHTVTLAFAPTCLHAESQSVSVQPYLERILEELGCGPAGGACISASFEGEISLPVDVAVSLGLVVAEILSNAFEHGGGGAAAPVEVAVRMLSGGVVRCRIRDRGRGMPQPAATPDRGATGLMLVRRLAEHLDARLEVHVAEGTCWSIEVPPKPTFRGAAGPRAQTVVGSLLEYLRVDDRGRASSGQKGMDRSE